MNLREDERAALEREGLQCARELLAAQDEVWNRLKPLVTQGPETLIAFFGGYFRALFHASPPGLNAEHAIRTMLLQLTASSLADIDKESLVEGIMDRVLR